MLLQLLVYIIQCFQRALLRHDLFEKLVIYFCKRFADNNRNKYKYQCQSDLA